MLKVYRNRIYTAMVMSRDLFFNLGNQKFCYLESANFFDYIGILLKSADLSCKSLE